MERTLINKISEFEGQKALVEGRVLNTRNLGNIVFLVLQDYTGIIQVVATKDNEAKSGDAISAEGTVKKDARAKRWF